MRLSVLCVYNTFDGSIGVKKTQHSIHLLNFEFYLNIH